MTPDYRVIEHMAKALAMMARENERLAQQLAKYEDVNPVTSVTEARTALTPAQKQSAYRARQSAKALPKALPRPAKTPVTVTQKVTPVVSSYKGDLESKKEPFKALSTLSSPTVNTVTRNAGNGNAVTDPPLREGMDPNSTSREWRPLMRAPR